MFLLKIILFIYGCRGCTHVTRVEVRGLLSGVGSCLPLWLLRSKLKNCYPLSCPSISSSLMETLALHDFSVRTSFRPTMSAADLSFPHSTLRDLLAFFSLSFLSPWQKFEEHDFDSSGSKVNVLHSTSSNFMTWFLLLWDFRK